MFNSQNGGMYLPSTTHRVNNYSPVDTIQAEIVNDELEYQNHRLQKNLLQQENYVRRYWRNENDKQMIANNEWSKYSRLVQDERWFLSNNHVSRDGDTFYYQQNQNEEVISGTKEEIELEASSRNSFNLCFVDDLNDIKGIRFDTIYVSTKSIDVLTQCIYDPNSRYGKVNHIGEISQNNFISTEYLDERFNDYSLCKEPSSVLYFIENITTYKDHAFLANRMGKHFKHLKSDNTMVFIHNQDVADLLWNSVITKIYGNHNVKVLDDEILDTQSVEEILDKTLYVRVDSIPEDLEKQAKLKKLITSVSIGYDRVQLFITLKEAHPFLEEFLSASNMIFLDSMQNLINKMRVQDKIDFTRQLEFNLNTFAKELSAIGSQPLNEDNYNNDIERQKYLESISSIYGNGISRNNILSPFDNSLESLIPVHERFKHCYITGQSGSGKTECLKSIVYSDILRNDGVVIVLEPHGDLTRDIAKLPIDKKRVIYLDPTLQEGMTPTLNLFDLKNRNEKNIQKIAKVIVSVVKSVNDDEKFSGAMEEMLYYCCCLLLRKGDSDFFELLQILNDKKNKELVKLGQNSPNVLEREYFEDYFKGSKPTQEAVKRRVSKILNDLVLCNLLNGSSTINLEETMNTKGNVIIFRIQKEEMLDSYIYYARFIIGLIQIIALKRASQEEDERVKTYCHIDEFHNFITPTIEEILTESRKYRLYLTLAHQAISQVRSPALGDIILSNTNIKLIGNNKNKTLEAMNKTLNIKLKDVEKLEPGEFYLSVGKNDILKVKNTDRLLNGKENITDTQWHELKQYQLKNYYRSTNVFNLDEAIKKFVQELTSNVVDVKYFEPLQNYSEKYAEFLYNLVDGKNGRFIAQPEMSFYFNIMYPEAHISDNKLFLSELRSRYEVFKQNPKDHKKYNDKFRYKLL